jgi:hypothetical protein
MDSTPMDSLDLSHVTVRSISNRRFSIPIKVETVENTEEITALIDYSESSSRTGGDNAYRGQRSRGTVPEVTQGTRALGSIVYTI